MKSFLFLMLLFKTAYASFRRPHDPTPEQKKFLKSLRGNYDPFKDVRLNDKRVNTGLPMLTREALPKHSDKLLEKSRNNNFAQLPIPPLQLRTLPYSKGSYNRDNLYRD